MVVFYIFFGGGDGITLHYSIYEFMLKRKIMKKVKIFKKNDNSTVLFDYNILN